MFWLCILALLVWPACVRGYQKQVTIVPTSTLPPDFYENITLSPSIGVNYTLHLSASGPAVIDSFFTFTADLVVSPNVNVTDRDYQYTWLNMADGNKNVNTGGKHSELRRFFSESDVRGPGTYLMTVIVAPASKLSEILAFDTIEFIITGRLNGNVNASQQLTYQRHNDTFATKRPVSLRINITDRFPREDSPDWTFYWYNHTEANASQLIERTQQPVLTHSFITVGTLFLDAETVVSFSSDEKQKPPDISEKHGLFRKRLFFKDELFACNSSRIDTDSTDQSVKLGDPVTLNVTCASGSAPTAVCWNVTSLNATFNSTCSPSEFENKTEHQVSVSLGTVGWQTVHVAIYNDVGYFNFTHNFYIYDAGTVNIPALVFPVVFSLIGIVIAVAGGAYIMRLRKTMHVEVADFDFDPTISVRDPHIFSSVAMAAKGLYRRFRYGEVETVGMPARPAYVQRSYSFYESL